ncbi:MAG TPA: DNA polymerase III subunit alpha [Longilinea sp.]|nr:DNA polymerase III subunit alpha [Longilinea sp.]
MFVHLTAHSAYSLLEGLALPSELAQAAQMDGMPALALTDHRLLTGSVEFVNACRKAGIQPLLGLEIDLESGPLSLLAMNVEGWSSLCRLSSALALQDDPEIPCSLDILSSFSRNLVALSGDQGDAYGRKLGELHEIFNDRLYLTLQDPALGVTLSSLGRQLSIPLVVTHPIYYLNPDQADIQRTLTSIRLNQPVDRIPPHTAAPSGSYFLSSKVMEERFWNFPVALAATEEIAQRCTFDLPLGVAHMPTVPIPSGLTAADYLRQKAEDGACRIYGGISTEVRKRLDHELEVIAHMGYEPIFLIVEEILNFARANNVPFSSRGSAASSLVAHCLGITSPDPLRLDLYFERFLNPARTTPPDIDTDLCSRRRDVVIQHVFDTYGQERAAMVGTINRFRPRSALGDVAKAHNISPKIVRELVEQLPYAFFSRMQDTDEETEKPSPSPFSELRAWYTTSPFPMIFDQAEALLKLPRHLSVHAGGTVVAPGLLTDLVPIMRSGSKGVTITQLDLGAVEDLGLVKIDLLGIRGLTVQGDVAEFIHNNNPKDYATPLSVLESTPSEDEETSQRLETGATIGCFQIESPGMRATLKEIRARTEDDLIAALALYRPGPLSGGLKDAFVRRFKGEEAVTHIHPALAPLLNETYGVILYQEQVLRIAHDLAGFSLAEADLLRRAMSHFDPGKKMKLLQEKFIAEAEARSGIPPETGERVWEMMAAFAGYGFPKAHAASYAKVSWRSAWCKTHFPAEFMAAVLANWGGYYSQRVYLSEARRMGLTIHAPHVNFSSRNFSVAEPLPSQKALFMGLDQVADLTRRTIERIILHRPFVSVEDFLAKVDPRRQEAESLVKVGALDGFGSIPSILQRIQNGHWQSGQPSLFDWQDVIGEDWSVEQKVAAQQELLGISLEAHPLELVAEKVNAVGAITTVDAAGRVGERVTVAGIRQSGHRSRTAKGESMMFLTLEDLSGMLDVVLFPDAYRQARGFVHGSEPILVTGVVEMDTTRGEPLLKAERVTRVL